MNDKQDEQQNLKVLFKTMPIIYIGLIAGQLLFAVLAWSTAGKPALNLKPGNDVFFYLVPLFILGTMLAGTMVYNRRIADVGNVPTLKEKIAACQTAFIIRWALSEGATLFAIVAFLQGENLCYLVFAGINIFYFLLLRPDSSKMEEVLNLSYEEKLGL